MKLKRENKKIKSENYLNEKGITLVALVITIVVLLILAGVSIRVLFSDNGIIEKAKNVQNKVDEAKNSDSEEINKVNNWIENTASGNNLTEETQIWVQNKTTVTKGTTTYGVGDDYTYDCKVPSYTGGWKVLGAENGKLLIMSTADIGTLELSGADGYNTGISKINEICKKYGTNARSIKVEDINRVTGYDPTKQGDGTIAYQNQWNEYGTTVTYTINGSQSSKGLTYTGALANDQYILPDGKVLGENDFNSVTIKNTYYSYFPDTLTGNSVGATQGIEKTSRSYKLLFRNTEDSEYCKYWLASSCTPAYEKYSNFMLRSVYVGLVGYEVMLRSSGEICKSTCGVRVVISL